MLAHRQAVSERHQLNRPGQLSGEHLRRIIRRRAVPTRAASRPSAVAKSGAWRFASVTPWLSWLPTRPSWPRSSTTSPPACWPTAGSDRSRPLGPSPRGRVTGAAATRPRSPPWPAPARLRQAAVAPFATGLWRRSCPQLRSAQHRAHSLALLPPHPRLHRPPPCRRSLRP